MVEDDDNNNKLPNSNKTIRSTTITTDRQYDIYDTVNENFNRALNEIAKFQPQYLQSISNLQLDYIQTIKNMIKNLISAQSKWLIVPITIADGIFFLHHQYQYNIYRAICKTIK